MKRNPVRLKRNPVRLDQNNVVGLCQAENYPSCPKELKKRVAVPCFGLQFLFSNANLTVREPSLKVLVGKESGF